MWSQSQETLHTYARTFIALSTAKPKRPLEPDEVSCVICAVVICMLVNYTTAVKPFWSNRGPYYMSCLACQQVDAIDGPDSYTMIHIGRGGRERKGEGGREREGEEGRRREGEEGREMKGEGGGGGGRCSWVVTVVVAQQGPPTSARRSHLHCVLTR